MVQSNNTAGDVLLEVSDFSLRFKGATKDLISHVSFSVRAGQTVCVVGESGCGKSVTSLAMMGLLPPGAAQISGGGIVFEGQRYDLSDPKAMRSYRGSRMTMIFQEPMTSLNPSFRIGDQIAEAVQTHGGTPKAEAEARALAMLKRVGIPAAEKRMREYPHQLSGGMRQRVMIAMALVNDPALLIADEPTTALDANVALKITDLLVRLSRERGMALVFITHDLAAVARATEDLIVMYGGDMVERGPTAQVLAAPAHPYTKGLLGARPNPARQGRGADGKRPRLPTIPGTVPALQDLPEGCRFAGRCPLEIAPCRGQRPVFRALAQSRSAGCHLLGGAAT